MPQPNPLMRGALPSPRSALAAAMPLQMNLLGAPPTFLTKPQQISMWGNDVHGDCVTAEEAFAKACHNPEIFITDAEVIAWATAHNVLEGAVISQVLQWMQNDGFVQGGNAYDDGPYFSVNWQNRSVLQSAIATGPVKIGIAADQLEAAYRSNGGHTGWFAHGFHADANEDHCVSLCGYGPTSWLAQQLGVAVPGGVNGNALSYALFTWNSIGIIEEASLLAITHEAWVRQPTTIIKKRTFPATGGNPVLIQSRFGTKGNFELVVPAAAGGLVHFWRNNDAANLPWSGPTAFGGGLGQVDAVTMIESNFGNPGNLELICRAGKKLQFFSRDSGPALKWNGPTQIEDGTAGNPVLIQSRFGKKGNFELVVPAAAGGLVHYWRNNDAANLPWSGPTAFGGGLGKVDAVTMIESNFGNPGNLEVICRVGKKLYAFWRDSGPAFKWNGPTQIEDGTAGNPVLIQSRYGTKGNFELVVPAAAGGLVHYWRNNDAGNLPWSGPTAFGGGLGKVDAVTMIESNFGNPGNLEVICRVGPKLYAFWRDANWNGPFLLESSM